MEALVTEANEVRSFINRDIHEAANKLLKLTNEYSSDLQLKKRALKVNWDLTRIEEENQSSDHLQNEIQDILNNILGKLETQPDDITDYRTRFEATRQFFIQHSHDKEKVFCGKGLSYQYGENDFALQPYDIDLYLGEITAVVGENSSGKSTLIKIIAGEHLAKSGELHYPLFTQSNGKHIDWRDVKENIAYIPQTLQPWAGKVKDYLHFSLAIKGIKGKQNVDEVEYIIHRLNLSEFQDKACHELSGGACMRVELARALIWKPKLLILDEPLANLDINAQAIFLRDLEQLASSHKNPVSVLITSQHLFEMENISHRTIFLKKNTTESASIGEVTYNGLTQDFGKNRQCNTFELSCKNSAEELRAVLLRHQINDFSNHGHYYLIKSGLNIDARALIKILSEANMEVSYFRDTSESTRTLFENI